MTIDNSATLDTVGIPRLKAGEDVKTISDEFSLINLLARRANTRPDVVLGIGDDAALLQVPHGQQLVITTDTLNSGVHFPAQTNAFDIGWKSLAVNLSDLAAMGAQAAWCSLSLVLPQADQQWLDNFCDGFFALATQQNVALIGGDTTRGPLSLSITALGWVPNGHALRRDNAQVGDDIWVSGFLGEAAGALQLWQGGQLDVSVTSHDTNYECLRQRLLCPQPRLALGQVLRSLAHAAVDISDGLLADVGHIAQRSGLAAVIEAAALPLSTALRTAFDENRARACALRGGDDYELCFTAAPSKRSAIEALAQQLSLPLTRIGMMHAGSGVICEGEANHTAAATGYRHFSHSS